MIPFAGPWVLGDFNTKTQDYEGFHLQDRVNLHLQLAEKSHLHDPERFHLQDPRSRGISFATRFCVIPFAADPVWFHL